jgi:membrane-associated protein
MTSLAAAFDTQLSTLAPLLFYLVIGGIIFIETGLFFGFFLPGSSVLLSAGIVAATIDGIDISSTVLVIVLSAFFGNQVGFVTGRVVGRRYLDKRTSPKIRKVIVNTEKFYEKTGWWAVVAARFIPWVRTFVPPIAGASKMNYYKFLSANILGAMLWGGGISIAGYYTVSIPEVKTFSYAIAGFFIIASVISGFVNYLRRPR